MEALSPRSKPCCSKGNTSGESCGVVAGVRSGDSSEAESWEKSRQALERLLKDMRPGVMSSEQEKPL